MIALFFDAAEGIVQFFHCGVVQGVQFLRPLNGDRNNAVRVRLEPYIGVGHGLLYNSYNSRASTRCAWTIVSHGDHAKTVKRPSWDATSAIASC
jgi:hypothetical protein